MSLADYEPERIDDDGGFEVIDSKGLVCKVEVSRVEDVPAGDRNGEAYDAYTRLGYELVVVSNEYRGRKFWKRFNLSSTKANKKGKTPTMLLLDIFHTAGVADVGVSSDVLATYIPEIIEMNDRFADCLVKVSAWGWLPEGETDKRQMHKIVGSADGVVESAAVTEDVPAF